MTALPRRTASATLLWLLSAGTVLATAPYDPAITDSILTDDIAEPQATPDQILAPPPAKAAPRDLPPPPSDNVAIDNQSGIAITEATTSSDSLGILAPADYGFNERVWEYLTISESQTLLNGTPPRLQPGVLRDAVIALLLTQANPPRQSNNDWLNIRITHLLRLGAISQANLLMKTMPSSYRDLAFTERYILSLLQAKDQLEACKALADYMERHTDSLPAPLEHLRLFCMTKGGGYDEAALALSIRNEAGNPAPAWFAGLLDSIAYPGSTVPAPTEELTGIDLALFLGAGGSAIPDSVPLRHYLGSEYAAYHGLIGRTDGYDPALQVEFLERAVLADSSLLDTLSKRYDELATSKKGDPVILRRATSYQSLVAAKSSQQALNAFHETLYSMLPSRGPLADITLLLPVKALSALLKDTPPYVNDAPYAFAILLRGGDIESAHKWVRMMGLHRDTASKTHIAYELIRFAEAKADVKSPEARTLPPFTIPDGTSEDELRMLRRYYRIMPLFDYAVPDLTLQMADEMLGNPMDEKGMNTLLLDRFSESGSVAGALLTAASMQGTKSLREMDDSTVIAIIDVLQDLEQHTRARQFALESVLAFY